MAASSSADPFSTLDDALLEAAVGLAPMPDAYSAITPAELSRVPSHTPPLPQPAAAAAEPFDHAHSSAISALPSDHTVSPVLSDNRPPSPRPQPSESAVDRAKRVAEDFTRAQLERKRRSIQATRSAKRRKSSSSSDNDNPRNEEADADAEDPRDDPASPADGADHKYQKRLQKNRDSAFVSRIRRREYTRVLEESLLRVERERDAAVSDFLEMKQRFQVVAAELEGIKQGASAAGNFSGMGGRLAHIFWPRETGAVPALSAEPQRARPAATMFMFAFMFGAIMPEALRERFAGLKVLDGRLGGGGGSVMAVFGGGMKSGKGAAAHGGRGTVWKVGGAGRGEAEARLETVLPVRQQLMATLRADAERLGEGKVERVVAGVEGYLNAIGEEEVEVLLHEVQAACAEGDPGRERLRRMAGRVRERIRVEEDEEEEEVLRELVEGMDCLTVGDGL